jgi:suppressor of ftsI
MGLTRRDLMLAAGVGTAGLVATSAGGAAAWSMAGPPESAADGPVLRSRNGRLRVDLSAGPGNVKVNGSSTGGLLTYNGRFPAPTMVVRPGDRLQIRLTNKTPTWTNLHFHGLHVSPRGLQDNVFAQIEPGDTRAYDVRIPKDHPSGLFWYHPHFHTETGPQVWAGMSGLLIVEGGAADLSGVKGLRRHAFGIREGGLGPDGGWADYTSLTPATSPLYVNGRINPRITMRPGETQFWQLGNIGVAAYYQVALDDHEFTVVEEDGAMVWRTWTSDTLFFPPGKRYGVLVTARKRAGVVQLRQLGYDQGKDQWPAAPLVRVQIEGERAQSVTVPEQIGDPPSWLTDDIAQRRVLTLSQAIVDGASEFYIDGMLFDNLTFADVIQVKLGTTEDWVIRNATSVYAGAPRNEQHPFHIHVNDFAVVETGDWDPLTNETSNRVRVTPRSVADTVNVPWNAYVRFRTHFADFVGRSVFHCHLLFHEDHGMMGVFDIVDSRGRGAGANQRLPTHSH